jgi:uncharacterized membrane protein
MNRQNSNNDSQVPGLSGPAGRLTEKNVEAIHEIEKTEKAKRTKAETVADAIARFCGSMVFVWINAAWFATWIVINTLPGIEPFDPFPFTFLTLTVSLEAIFLSIFILISQNFETKLAERRNHLDLQINLLSEQENTKMIEMLQAITEKLGIDVGDDPHTEQLRQETHPEHLAHEIDRRREKDD